MLVKALSEAFEGRLSVILLVLDQGLSVKELGELGVARCSIGPQLMRKIQKDLGDDVARILGA